MAENFQRRVSGLNRLLGLMTDDPSAQEHTALCRRVEEITAEINGRGEDRIDRDEEDE